MRFSILLALTTAFVFSIASQANALSSVGVFFLDKLDGTGCGESVRERAPGTSYSCVEAEKGDILKMVVTVEVDSLGLAAFAFDLRWDADGGDVLDYVNSDDLPGGSYRRRGALNFEIPNPSPPPDTVTSSYKVGILSFASQESKSGIGSQEGYFYGFDATGSITGPFVDSVSFRINVVSFEVVNEGSTDFTVGFFRTSGPAFGTSDASSITPNFLNVTVQVPEPGTSLLIATSLATLALLAVRSKRD